MMNIRTGNISYTVTNNTTYNIDKSILIDFTNYTWTYTIELQSDNVILCLYIDKDNHIDNKIDHIRLVAQNCTTIYQLRNLKIHKYSFTKQLLDNLYNELKNKYAITDIPEKQKTEFYNKIIYNYIELWNHIMNHI